MIEISALTNLIESIYSELEIERSIRCRTIVS